MIVIISAVFPPEPVGSSSLVFDLALSLSEIHSVKVITPKPSRPKGFCFMELSQKNTKYEHIILSSYTCPDALLFGRMRESCSFGIHAAKYIKKFRSEIQCIYLNSWPLFAQYFIAKAAKKYSIPYIAHMQDIYPESLANRFRFFRGIVNSVLVKLDKYILRNASRIIAISENMFNTYVVTRGISADKIRIVKNWQNEDEFIYNNDFKSSLNSNILLKKPFTFMYLGNIGSVAGIELLIVSFAKANLKEALLVIAGDGSNKNNCIEFAKSFNNVAIEFRDVPYGKVPEIQLEANIMLLPFKKGTAMSSIPSKLAAYMFSQKPIITCVEEESDTAYAIKKADCGWILPPEDVDALAKKIIEVTALPRKVLLRMGVNGYKYAMQNYSKKKNLLKLITIISEFQIS